MNTELVNEYGDPLPTDPKVLQARLDSTIDAFGVERNVRNALLSTLQREIPAADFADILQKATKAYTESFYAVIGAEYASTTGGEDLFANDSSPTGL